MYIHDVVGKSAVYYHIMKVHSSLLPSAIHIHDGSSKLEWIHHEVHKKFKTL
jgi:hypothetical protein